MGFDHERLIVYQRALEFAALLNALFEMLPPGFSKQRDQLERAACSILANIAEAAGSFSPGNKFKYFSIAKASADECAGILDYLVARLALRATDTKKPKAILLEVVKMLATILRNLEVPNS
jgi:four helix bundle protein